MELHEINSRLKKIESLLISQKDVLTLDDVAEYTKLSKSYLYKLTSTGGIPCYRPQGKQLFFEKSELNAWLMRNKLMTKEEIASFSSSTIISGK